MTNEPPRKHVSHPILRLDVLGPDGKRQSAFRVFCRERGEAVPVGVCCACVHCEGVATGPFPAVNCLVTESRADLPFDPLGLVTPVAEVLTSTFAVDEDMTLRDAMAHLHAEDRRSVPVVDRERVVVGIIHDGQHPKPLEVPVTMVMSARISLPADTPVRRALAVMAAAHLREIVVVDDRRVPLGTFRDVDGLHWLAAARRQEA